jgi:erythrocyte band 7 integral membrane protein
LLTFLANKRLLFLQIEATAEKWGVAIESILLKDINFSIELQQSLSSAATQKRIGESKVIAARAEVDAAKLMRQGMCHSYTPGMMLTLYR